MLESVVVVGEGAAGVVGRIDEDALHLPSIFLLQGFQREQVVAADQDIVEAIILADAMLGVIRQRRIFEQDTRLQSRTIVLADLGEFELLLLAHAAGLRPGSSVAMNPTGSVRSPRGVSAANRVSLSISLPII